MVYSEEEINKYLSILNKYKEDSNVIKSKKIVTPLCKGCQNTLSFSIYFGLKICNECGMSNGHLLGYFNKKDLDRLYYRKKSIYQRKYYYEKKVNQISKMISLKDEEKYELFRRLMNIDNNIIKIINKQYSRNRLININYLIKKILEDIGCENSIFLKNNISQKIFNIYENWWKSYKELIK